MPIHSPIHPLGRLITFWTFSSVAIAAQNPGAHEHGQAQLQMAVEKNRVELMFTSPAYNLVGFEHEARTGDEKKKVSDVSQWLESTALINTETDACRVASVTVQPGGETESHDGHDHHKDEAGHRDYKVTQQLSCSELGGSDTLISPLPGRFPELRELTIEWAGPAGQGSALLTPSGRTFTLDE